MLVAGCIHAMCWTSSTALVDRPMCCQLAGLFASRSTCSTVLLAAEEWVPVTSLPLLLNKLHVLTQAVHACDVLHQQLTCVWM